MTAEAALECVEKALRAQDIKTERAEALKGVVAALSRKAREFREQASDLSTKETAEETLEVRLQLEQTCAMKETCEAELAAIRARLLRYASEREVREELRRGYANECVLARAAVAVLDSDLAVGATRNAVLVADVPDLPEATLRGESATAAASFLSQTPPQGGATGTCFCGGF